MVGTALVNNLKNIRDNKNKKRPGIHIGEIYEYDRNSTYKQLDEYCRKADFVFHLAVVTNTIPNTGITLPFVSYGGTSVVFLLIEMGLVLSVSRMVQ